MQKIDMNITSDNLKDNLLLKIFFSSKISLDDADKSTPRDIEKRKLKRDTIEIIDALCEDRDMVLNDFKSGIFPLQATEGLGSLSMSYRIAEVSEILSPKKILQRLSIALAQVKAGNTSESLLNEFHQIICSLY